MRPVTTFRISTNLMNYNHLDFGSTPIFTGISETTVAANSEDKLWSRSLYCGRRRTEVVAVEGGRRAEWGKDSEREPGLYLSQVRRKSFVVLSMYVQHR